ncbi:MAG: hypothetical protein ABI462_05415, partial [Ignavibacteria bacterium]
KQILVNAGDDKFKAIRSGVTFVGRDSTGQGLGLYAKADTVIGKSTITYYKYLPNDSNALYQITFSSVGQGKGNYLQQSQLQYNFAGPSQGSYDTIVFLPLPNAYQVADVKLNYLSSPAREFTLDLESAVSTLDANKFSTLSDDNNNGVALYGTLGVNKYNFNLLGMKLRTFELTLKEKLVNKVFEPLERVNPVEFYRQYDIQDTNRLTEDLHEATLRVAPSNYMDLKATFGQLLRGDQFNSLRTVADLILRDDSLKLPDLNYKFELINSDYSIFNLKSRWIRQFASAGYRKFLGTSSFDSPSLELRFDFNQENKKNNIKGSTGDSLESGSFSFFELRPRIILNNFYNLNIYGEFGYRDDNIPLNGVMLDQANSFTQTFGVRYGGLNWLSTLLEMTFRKKTFTDAFISESNTNDNTLLVNWQTRVDPFSSALMTDFFYNITSERQAKIEKVFVEVRVGEGNYVYLGDLNGNGFKDENEFQLTNFNDGNYIRINRPTSELFPVTALNTSVRFTLKPERFFHINGSGFLSEVIRNTSTETYFRTEEKSKDPNSDNIYFLHFNTFQNDSNTLIGTQLFQQDINFFEFNPLYSLKFRYIEQKNFNQFVSGNERLLGITKSLKLKLGLTKDFTTLFEYANILDRNSAPLTSVRNRDIKSDGVLTDFSYRPVQQIESGFQLNFIRAIDRFPFAPTQADINQQIIRFIYSFTFLGRLRLEIERDEVLLSNSAITFPYELTNGRQEGKSFLWRAFFDYSISKNLQATFNYDGRSEAGARVIHSGRAEVKAFF